MQKSDVRDAIVSQLRRELELQARAAHESRDEATSTENKQEGKFDMRGQEAAYLAEGQARQAAELAEAVVIYQTLELPDFSQGRPAAVGALVTLEVKTKRSRYFLGPRNGGMEIRSGDDACLVVTPASPLGRQLLDRRVGDTVQLPGRGSPLPAKVVEVL